MKNTARVQRGFTLVELVMVIVVMGVIATTLAVFIKGPVDAYFATGRRAALADTADTALRRMSRDIRAALPNSVRVNGTGTCLEFIAVRGGGRYLSDGSVNALAFGAAGAGFTMQGDNAAGIAVGDFIVVANQNTTGTQANAYVGAGVAGGNVSAAITAVATSGTPTVTNFTVATNFGVELASPDSRFYAVPGAASGLGPMVSYVCTGTQLTRTVSGSFAANCPANGPVIANNVSACNFVFNQNSLRDALAYLTLGMTTSDGEAISLQHQVHIDNTP